MATEAQINAIVGLYVAYFDRAPDPAGLQFWIDQLDNGRDFTTISQDFADSAEAQAIYPYLSDDNDLGTISPVAFITNIYANLFGRVPDQAGLEFWTEVLESGAVAPGDMVEAISLGAKDNLNDNGFFDRSVLDNKIECARYFTEQAGEIGSFPQGDQPGQFEIGSPEYLAAVGAVGAAGNQMDNLEECQDFIDTLLREFIPNSSFTLCPVKVLVTSSSTVETAVTEKVLYWGFANTDGTGTPNPGENGGTDSTSVISNGIPADAFFGPGGYFQTLALQEFAELDVIDTDLDQFSIIDWSSVTDISITVNNSTGGEDGDNDIVDGNNEGGVLTVTYPDGSTDDIALGDRYFDFLCKLVLDEDGNSRFYEQEVVVGLPVYINADGEFTTTPQAGQEPVGTIDRGLIEVTESGSYEISWNTPLVLTPTENNGGTKEAGFTSDDNDFIQVGIVDLLHGAIIDGGGGYNTLEIDAKGHFAQPKALNNIQQISIENLPNIYTIDGENDDVAGNGNGTQYPDVVGDESGESDGDNYTIIDLSRATELENVTITEGRYTNLDADNTYPDALTVTGLRNDATLTLQGHFYAPLYVFTSEGNSGDGFTVILQNVNASDDTLYITDNSARLNLVSEGGGNVIYDLDGDGDEYVTHLVISGDAHLFIESSLDEVMADETPVIIDASANTGGVDLNYDDYNPFITFIGSQGNDRFSAETSDDGTTAEGPDHGTDERIDVVSTTGNNYWDLETYELNLTDGDGNNQLKAYAGIANATFGNGNNTISIESTEVNLTVGNGDNFIDIETSGETDSFLQKERFDEKVVIVAGDGANEICVDVNDQYSDQPATVDITAGDGGNIIEVKSDDGDAPVDVTINTGTGSDTIKAIGSSITINSGGGNDTITLVGIDDDFVTDEVDTENGSGDSALEAGDVEENPFEDGVLLNIDTGTGSADIHLGMAGEGEDGIATMNVIAKDGSVITGEDITLHVNSYANLIGASLSGVTSVVLDDDAGDRDDSAQSNDIYAGDRAQLTLTVDQFLAIGAENFGVDGSLFDTHAFIKLIVDEDTSLDALGIDNLSRNIDLYLEIRDGAEVTMTAEQLHTKLARDGVTLAEDGNTDYGAGSVVITGGGFNFDPFNTNDKVQSVIAGTTYFGGSLSSDFGSASGGWFNVQVQSVYGGYDRPADVAAEVVLTIDSDTTPEVDGFGTWHTNLEIVGDSDVTFNGAIDLGQLQGASSSLFTIDFSELLGTATGLTIGNFETVREVRGNGNNGFDTEVFVEISNNSQDGGDVDIGFDNDDTVSSGDADDRVLITSGVARYVVTKIDGPTMMDPGGTATIRLNDVTQDVEVFALRGNWNDTLEILDAAWGLNFELQAGGTLKSEGPTKYANVGSLDASFKWYCAETTVEIFHSVEGDTRTIKTGSIVLDNVETANINATGDTIIESISGTSDQGQLDTINLTGTGDLEILEKIDASESDGVNTIDASGVAGVVTLGIDGGFEEDIDEGMGNDFTFIGSDAGSVVTLCDVDDDWAGVTLTGGAAGMDLIIADGDGIVDLDESTLTNINSITLEPGSTLRIQLSDADAVGADNILFGGKPNMDDPANLQLAGLGEEPFAIANYNPGINVSLLSLANQPEITLNPATDLTGIGGLEVPEGTILNLTAEQFQQLDGDGAITGVDGTTNFTVNITDWTQASVDFDDGDDTDADNFTLMGITADNVTITMAEDVELGADDGLATAGGLAEVITIDGVTLTLADVQQADGLQIGGGTGTTLKFTDPDSGVFESIDASGFNVDTLLVLNVLVADRNVDRLFFGLPETVTKQIYTGIGFVDGVTQNVIIEEGTTVPGFLAFVRPEADTELRILNLTMEGGTEIDGDLLVSASTNEDGQVQANLQEVNIVSTGTAGNLINGETANVITGNLTPIGLFTFITGTADGDPYLSISNDLLNVNISGDQDFILEGQIIFESVTAANNPISDDGITANDDEEAVATLTVNNSASTTIGDLDTDDEDVDFLVVNNEGTGDLTIGISSTATVDPEDVITLNGSATGTDTVIVSGGRDFSGDTIEADWDFIQFNNNDDGAGVVTVTVTQQQFGDIGVGGFLANGDGTAAGNDATLNIVDFDGAVPFDATGLDGDITVGTITMLPGVQTLDPSTNLTGVGKIDVPEGGTLNLSAAQYQQLVGIGGLKICAIDGPDTGTGIGPITVNVTGLTQADIDGGPFDLSMIEVEGGSVSVTLAESVELSADDVVQDNDGTPVTVNMSDGQDLGIALFSQADALNVVGTGDTDVFFRFDDEDGTPVDFTTSLDASGYDVTQLHALNVFVGGRNVEFLLDDLASAVELVIYNDPEDLGFLNQTNRVVIIEPGVTVPSVGGTALGFNDLDVSDEVTTVTMTALGGVIVDGDIRFGNQTLPGGSPTPVNFMTFTFISEGDGTVENAISGGTDNIINGDITAVSAGPFPPNNLLDVNLMADHPLVINGTIFFNGLAAEDDTASLDVSGTAPVTIDQVDVESAEGTPEITDFSINNTGTSTLTITGSSNSIELSPAVETLTFTGTGDIVLDTTTSVAEGDSGISGPGLSTLDATGLSGDLTLGTVEDVDDDDFSFTSGTGVTTMTMAYDDLAAGATINDTGWSFDFTAADVGSKLTLGPGLTTAAGSDLSIDMGANGTLCIDQSLNLTDVNASITSANAIVLADGAELFLTAAQADGLTIVGENGAASTGVVHIVGLGDTPVDLSGISADVAGYVFLEDDDVSLDPATNLGNMTVGLIANDPADLNPAGGQTLRLAVEGQADGLMVDVIESIAIDETDPAAPTAVLVDWDDASGGSTVDGNLTNSTNIAWLFDSVAGPLDTSMYDPSLGRLWFSNDLLNSVGGAAEQLFNTLPDTILRVDFNTVVELDILLASAAVDRVVELTSFTDIVGLTEVDDGISPEEHIATLTVDFGGEVTAGDFVVGDVVAAPDTDPLTPDFTTLTLNSRTALSDSHYLATEDHVNNNDGVAEVGETVQPMTVNTIGDILVGGTNPLIELMDVVINTFDDPDPLIGSGTANATDDDAGADFVFGTLIFNSAGDDVDALLTITGENDVTGKAVDASDADITSVVIDTSGHTGTFVLTGGSPGFSGGDDDGDGNTETLTFDNGSAATGEVWVGHVFDEGAGEYVINTDGTDAYAGIDASTLSTIETFDHGGTVNLGVVADIDSEDFRISNDDAGGAGDGVGADGAGVGTVNLCLGEGLDADGNLVSPELSATGRWEFDNGTGVTGTMNLELKTVTFNAGGQLELDGVDVVISGDIDLSALDPADISISGGSISVAAGGKLTLTVEQVDALTGIPITGEGTICVIGESDNGGGAPEIDTDFAFLQTATVDLSAVTLAATDDGVLQITASGATDDAGDPTTQTIIGSANDDAVTIAGSASDGDAGTIDVITRLGADGGDIGDPNATPTGNTPVDAAEVIGDTITNATAANIQVEADAGFDTFTGVKTGDVVQISAGAEFYGTTPVGGSFVATTDTSNTSGTGVIELIGDNATDTTLDLSAAGGDTGWSLIGSPDSDTPGLSQETIIGSEFADDNTIIDGAADPVDTAADGNAFEEDTFTGNAGADRFVFNVSATTPAAMSNVVDTQAVDEETVEITAAEAADDDDESLTFDYAAGNVIGSVTIQDGPILGDIDFMDTSSIATALATALNNLAGVTAAVDGGNPDLVVATGDNGERFDVTLASSANAAATDAGVVEADGTDTAQSNTVTITGTANAGEVYTLTVMLSEGTDITAEYLAAGGESAAVIAGALVADFNATAPAGTVLATDNADGTITLDDEEDDNGGFTVTVLSATSSVAAASFSSLLTGGETFASADMDVITDFMDSEGDLISFGLDAGTSDNYDEAAYEATFGDAQTAADTAFADDSDLLYFLTGSTADASGLLFLNLDGDTDADAAIALTGVDLTNFDFDNIV